MESGFDYLIVSDLHLRGGYENPTERLYHFDEEFADLLRYYRLNRSSTRPWQLIICGDFVEFLYITDRPEPDDRLLRNAVLDDGEMRYGLSTEAPKARWKLDRILRSSHPQLLLSLARFIAEGNSIVVLRGNHDAEMYWPEVQDHFRRLIAEHHPEDIGYMAMKEAVQQRLHFGPWFWYVPGVLYTEHGCQYDPFCSFEYFMYPVIPQRPARIENSISDLSIRYFANTLKLTDAMAAEGIKSVSEYIKWFVRGKMSILPRAAGLYGGMVRRVLAKSGRPRAHAEAVIRTEHEQRMAANDADFGLAPGTTAKLQAMHATPVMRSFLFAARFLGLDLIATAVLLTMAVAVILIKFPTRAALLAIVGVAAVAGIVVYVGALRVQRIVAYGALRRIAERIAEIFKVPNVIFGHSHRAGSWPLSDASTYFNVGTWVPMAKNAYFVYFVVAGDGANRHSGLWRWNKREQRPEPFGSSDT